MATNVKTYKRRDGTNADHGHKFELDLTILTYIRCLKLYNQGILKSFMIANNVDCVGDFDDVVCRIEYEENGSPKTKLIFVQAKHKEDPYKAANCQKLQKKKQEHGNEVYISKQKISKYITSYLQTRKIFNENEDFEELMKKFTSREKSNGDESMHCRENLRGIFKCKLQDSLFILYTNEHDDSVSYFQNVMNDDNTTKIFDTSDNTGIHKLMLGNRKLSGIFSKSYKLPQTPKLTEDEMHRINQFEDQLRVYLSQEKEHCLEDTIKNEIRHTISSNNVDTAMLESLYSNLYKEIKQYFSCSQSPFLTEATNFVEGIFAMLKLQTQTMEIVEKYLEWSEMFTDDIIVKLHKEVLDSNFTKISTNSLPRIIAFVYFTQLAAKINKCVTEWKSTLILYIKNEKSFQMWNAFRTLPSYTKYSNVFLFSNIEVRSEDVCNIWMSDGEQQERIISLSDDQNIALESTLQLALSSEGLEKIMNYNRVLFQALQATLKDIFGNNVCQEILKSVLHRVLNKEILLFGSSLPEEDKIYIERRYKKNSTLLKFEAINESKDIFIIYPNHIASNSLSTHNSTNVFIYENEEDARKKYISLLEGNRNVHFCNASKDNLEIIFSKEDLKNIKKFVIDQNETNEEEFLQQILNNEFTILSDDVGMGKSTALKHLTHCIKKKVNKYWAQYIDLNLQSKHLETWNKNVNSIEFIATDMLKLDNENKIIFQHKCNTEGDVALLFDGFDELAAEYRIKFLEFIKTLSKSKINTIVISSRTIAAGELNVCLGTFSFSLYGFSYENMSSYLLKYWSVNGCEEKQEKLHTIVANIVKHVQDNKETLTAVATVPLQTKMLALTYIEKVKEALSTENETDFGLNLLNVYSLYNNFINMHIKRCVIEKHQLHESIDLYCSVEDMYKSDETEKWEALACKEIFPTIKMCEVRTTDADLKKIQQIGIVVNKEPIKFVHRSFAEFLTAKYVSRLLFKSTNTTHLNQIYQIICVDENFNVLRKFMNAYYENERHWEISKINKKWFPGLFGFVVDEKTLMTAAKEGNPDLFKAILRHLSRNDTILRKILNYKNDHEENLLHVSAKYCEEVFDDILFSKFFQHAKECDITGRTALHEACEYGRENAVKSYINRYKNESLSAIIDQTDENMDTPLILAAQKGHTKIVKILHHHGASIHSRDEYARTALMYAAEYGRIETVKYLIEQFDIESPSANTDQTDEVMFTPLMLAAEEGHTNIVKILHHHGASIHSKDKYARTALMYAAREGHIETVKYLIEQGAEVDGSDSDGKSALIYSCKNTGIFSIILNVGCIKFLLEQAKANVNIHDHKGRTAVMHSIMENDNIDILKCLFQHGADITAIDCDGKNAAWYADKYERRETGKYLRELEAADANQDS